MSVAPFAGSGPQSQREIAEPAVTATVPAASAHGLSTIALPLTVELMPVTTTWISPATLVLIDVTYFDTCAVVELDSQPQLPAAGKLEADCALSVMLVRQADRKSVV